MLLNNISARSYVRHIRPKNARRLAPELLKHHPDEYIGKQKCHTLYSKGYSQKYFQPKIGRKIRIYSALAGKTIFIKKMSVIYLLVGFITFLQPQQKAHISMMAR